VRLLDRRDRRTILELCSICSSSAAPSHRVPAASSGSSGRHHHLDRLALGHRAVAVRHVAEADGAVEDAAGVDAAFEDVGQKLVDVADGCGAAADGDVVVEGRFGGGDRLVLRYADAARSPVLG
jgi:hypothetical protein